jgi:RND family efflux transporter MFP subunit
MKQTFMLLSIYAVLLFSACSYNKENNNKQQEKYPVTSPIILDTTLTQEYVADIHAIQNVEIRARVKGFIDKIHVDEGQYVEAGQLLFTINSQEFKQELLRANAQLKSAIAEYKMAEVDVNNAQTLVSKNIVSKSELEMMKAKSEAAQAKIEEAESIISSVNLNIAFASVKAPFSGVINRLPLKTGSLLDEGTLLTTLSNDKEVFAYFNLSEKEYLSMLKDKDNKQHQTVKLLMVDGTIFPYEGQVETVDSEIDKGTGNLAFRARFKNPDRVLKHGSSGKIRLLTKLSKAMIIPQKATFEVQENTYVYVVDKGNKIRTQNIIITQRLPHLYVIESGLAPEDVIVYEGIQTLQQGDKIIPEMKPLRSLLNQLSVK